ncbi:LysR family transcriptional regulator [Burkholderia gladioli]|uniref:LysR family transcriptional regulator n=1 Tax=Burkholderia gladioli (strain BSR3) TaxID=999541 RepID=F2LHR4_BURGS|nr:LysR family transcriptional regulator [Burkholderia gladioli]AEA58991.1 LysR family transcriptional regulator [Burkholderia gladioli BSR3]MBA1365863.1 LysR family transcriptional regulator [Burkholderia gladioli]MBW5287722.1 LysR family transcriptional regulator [Burkholderia gladioli]
MTRSVRAALINDRLDWNLLRTFLVIAREQSVSRAAAHLHITQPAVSHALRRLEEQLGRKLVQRSGPRIDITRAGNEVREIAEEIYGSISRLASDEGEGGHYVSGQVRLITVSGVQSEAYDDFLADFHADYPDIDFEVQVMRSADVPSALLQHTATAALSLNRHVGSKIAQQLFMPQRYALFCGRRHPLFGREGLSVEDLREENFVSFAGDQLGASLSVLGVFRDQHGLAGRVVATSASMAEVMRLIVAGFGIGSLPEHVGQAQVAAGRMMRLPPAEGIADLDVVLLWAAERKPRAAEAVFLERLRAFAAGQVRAHGGESLDTPAKGG